MAALNTVYVLLAIAVICCQSAARPDNGFNTQSRKEEKNDINIKLKVDKNSTLYHKGAGGRFEYGLDVPEPERDQYQHKEHRVDDVTYGCYGHIDPKGGSHNTLYISGSFGYRPLHLDGKNISYPDIDEEFHWKNFPENCTTDFDPPPIIDPPTTITTTESTLTTETTPKTPEPTPPKTTTTTTTTTTTPRTTPRTTPSTTRTTSRTTSTTRTTPTTPTTTTPDPPTPSTPRTTPSTPSTTPASTTPYRPRKPSTTPSTTTPTSTTPFTEIDSTTPKSTPTTEDPGRPITTTPHSTTNPPSSGCISEDAAKQIESVIDMLQNLLKSSRCPDNCDSGRSGDDSTPQHVLLPLVLVDKLRGKSGIPVGSKFAIPSVTHEQTKCNTCG